MAHKATLMTLAATALFLLAATNATAFAPFSAVSIPIGADKVNVNFYYESLCQSCKNFIGELENLKSEWGSALNLRLVPWGNAKIVNGNFVCQYGPDECYLNAVQACAIHRWPDLETHMGFIHCSENAYRDWTSCVTRETAQELQQCAKSNLGKNLQLAFAYETQNLNPPHEFVPWVTVNNLPLRKDIFNIRRYICDAYKGSDPPADCIQRARVGDKQEEYRTNNKLKLETCKKN